MKKIIVIALAFVLIASMSATAFAAPMDNASTLGAGQTLQVNAVQLDSTASSKPDPAFRQTVLQDRETIFNNRVKNTDLVLQNKQLRLEIAQAIGSIKKSGAKLSDDTKAQLKNDNTQLKGLVSSLAATKGQVQSGMDAFKAAVKNRDSSALQTAFSQVTSVQNSRDDLLTQINGMLQNIKTLLASTGTNPSPSASATVNS